MAVHYCQDRIFISDSSLHHHAARAAGPHPARPCGEELPGAGEGAAGGPQQADARRGEVRGHEHCDADNIQNVIISGLRD